MKKLFVFFSLISFAVVCLSCSENTASSNDDGATFSILLYDGHPKISHGGALTMTDQGGTTFTITYAMANVQHILFGLPEGETDSTKQVYFTGPFVMDLIEEGSSPEIGVFDLQPGIYKHIDVEFGNAKAQDSLVAAGDELMDNTLVVKGTFDYSDSKRDFAFIFKLNENLTFEEPAGITVSKDKRQKFLVLLLVEHWMSDINITNCLDSGSFPLDENGDLLIDETIDSSTCDNFLRTVKTNIISNYELN